MAERQWRIALAGVFVLAVGCLLLYRPVLQNMGFDLDHRVPAWADFFTPGQYDAFLDEVNAYCQAEKLEIWIDNGTLRGQGGAEYSLRMLAQKCLHLQRDAWAEAVRRYFDGLRQDTAETKPVPVHVREKAAEDR